MSSKRIDRDLMISFWQTKSVILDRASAGIQLASSSFSELSMKWVSPGLSPGTPTRCPQIDGMTRSLMLGIWPTSILLSSGGK